MLHPMIIQDINNEKLKDLRRLAGQHRLVQELKVQAKTKESNSLLSFMRRVLRIVAKHPRPAIITTEEKTSARMEMTREQV